MFKARTTKRPRPRRLGSLRRVAAPKKESDRGKPGPPISSRLAIGKGWQGCYGVTTTTPAVMPLLLNAPSAMLSSQNPML
jgi:hypothetical protein